MFGHSHTSPLALPSAADPDRDFVIRTILGLAPSGGSEPGEVLAALREVPAKDGESWRRAWSRLGERSLARARDAITRGIHRTAAACALRAANYLSVAVDDAAGGSDDEALRAAFRVHREAWDLFVAHTDVPATPIAIPLPDGGDAPAMPGVLFHSGAGPRPTIVFVNGSDGAISTQWGTGVRAALDRGWNAVVFDGPGQQSMLFEHGVPFRAQWGPVLTAVVDHLQARADVRKDALVVWGISQAGYWVAEALASEHRFAAAVLDPGVVDVATSWIREFPASMMRLLDEGKDDTFDSEMAMSLKLQPHRAQGWRFRARPYAQPSAAATVRAVREYTLSSAQANAITTPLLLTDPEGEQFWPGQSRQLASMTASGIATVAPFTADEGAQLHCEPLARTLVHERVFAWLTERGL